MPRLRRLRAGQILAEIVVGASRWGRRRRLGKRDAKEGPPLWRLVEIDVAAVCARDLTRNGEAEPGARSAARLLVGAAPKRLEHARTIGGLHAGPAVGHLN